MTGEKKLLPRSPHLVQQPRAEEQVSKVQGYLSKQAAFHHTQRWGSPLSLSIL